MIQCLNTRFDISSCHLYQNHFDAAREDAELCERLSVQIRSPRSEMLALMGLYFQHIAIKGDVSSGKPLTERSLMLTRQLGAPALEAFNLTWVARAENMAGDRNRALQHLDHAIEICHERAMKFCGRSHSVCSPWPRPIRRSVHLPWRKPKPYWPVVA